MDAMTDSWYTVFIMYELLAIILKFITIVFGGILAGFIGSLSGGGCYADHKIAGGGSDFHWQVHCPVHPQNLERGGVRSVEAL